MLKPNPKRNHLKIIEGFDVIRIRANRKRIFLNLGVVFILFFFLLFVYNNSLLLILSIVYLAGFLFIGEAIGLIAVATSVSFAFSNTQKAISWLVFFLTFIVVYPLSFLFILGMISAFEWMYFPIIASSLLVLAWFFLPKFDLHKVDSSTMRITSSLGSEFNIEVQKIYELEAKFENEQKFGFDNRTILRRMSIVEFENILRMVKEMFREETNDIEREEEMSLEFQAQEEASFQEIPSIMEL